VQEFEPFVRCLDALGIGDTSLLCPKNTTRAIPSRLEGQPDVKPLAPSIMMMSCEEASILPGLGMPDPEYCFNGEKTRDMSDEDYRVLTELRQNSNETRA
jgi:hypothetical protein